MKGYLTSAALILAGLIVYFFVIGFSFTGLLLCGIGVLVLLFTLLKRLQKSSPKAASFLRKLLICSLCVVLLASLATGIWIGTKAKGAEEFSGDYVIVLGAGVNGSVPSRPLRERLQAAKAYLEEHPQAMAVLSGGKGSHENISEARCMYDWLTERGISPERLRMEDKATSTQENLRFSLDLIQAETGSRPERVTVISNEYHLARASIFAQNEGIEAEGSPAKTSHPMDLFNMFLREIPAVWYALFQRLWT